MIIVSLCDKTGNMLKPWANAGYKCVAYDIQHSIRQTKIWDYPSGGSIHYRWGDVRSLTPRGNIYMVFAFPPCTHLAISGAVSRLSSSWRKPDYTFDPCDYGDGYTKKTHLWTGNGFVMPKKNRVEVTQPGYIHRMGIKKGRSDKRSATPMGFARAVFKANAA